MYAAHRLTHDLTVVVFVVIVLKAVAAGPEPSWSLCSKAYFISVISDQIESVYKQF